MALEDATVGRNITMLIDSLQSTSFILILHRHEVENDGCSITRAIQVMTPCSDMVG